MGIKHPFFFKFGTVLLSLFLSFLVAEILLRTLDIPHFYKPHSNAPQFQFFVNKETNSFYYTNTLSDTIIFKYGSNPRGYFSKDNTVEHHTNSEGFRGPEFKRDLSPNTIKILFLGASITFGEGVRFENTIPEATKRMLSEKFPKQNINFEMYNLGVGGYNTTDELFLLKNLDLKLNPDFIVFVYNLSDPEPPSFELSPEKIPVRRKRASDAIAQSPKKTIFSHFRLTQLVGKVLAKRKQQARTESFYQALYEESNEGWKNTQNALKQIALLLKEKNIPTLVVSYPIFYRLDDTHPFLNIYSKVEKAVKETGMEFIDLFPAFKGKKEQELWVYPSDQHPNEIAHEIAAKKLTESLLSQKEFMEKIRLITQENVL